MEKVIGTGDDTRKIKLGYSSTLQKEMGKRNINWYTEHNKLRVQTE